MERFRRILITALMSSSKPLFEILYTVLLEFLCQKNSYLILRNIVNACGSRFIRNVHHIKSRIILKDLYTCSAQGEEHRAGFEEAEN